MSTRQSRITDLVAEEFGVNRDTVTADTHLERDLGCDSLDLIELTMALEDEFSTQINDDDAYRCKTVGDIFNLVSNVLD